MVAGGLGNAGDNQKTGAPVFKRTYQASFLQVWGEFFA